MSGRFTLEGIKNIKQTGSLINSSKSLGRMLAKNTGLNDRLILELGAGEGSVTRHILNEINSDAELHSFEINESFTERLKLIEDSRLYVRNECVTCIPDFYGKGHVVKENC